MRVYGCFNERHFFHPHKVGQKYTNKDKDLIIGKQVGTYYYNLNPAIKPLNNVKVRKALSMALNRKELTDKVTMGGQIPAEGVVPYGILDINGQEFRKVSGNFIKEDLDRSTTVNLAGTVAARR